MFIWCTTWCAIKSDLFVIFSVMRKEFAVRGQQPQAEIVFCSSNFVWSANIQFSIHWHWYEKFVGLCERFLLKKRTKKYSDTFPCERLEFSKILNKNHPFMCVIDQSVLNIYCHSGPDRLLVIRLLSPKPFVAFTTSPSAATFYISKVGHAHQKSRCVFNVNNEI